MRKSYKTISLFLALSLLQFFAPVLNVAIEPPCCEEQGDSTGSRQCCQPEFPSRIVCCVDDSEHAMDDSAPTQAISAKSLQPQIVPAASDQFLEISLCLVRKVRLDQNFCFFNPHLVSNEHYKLLATFLI